MGESGGDRKAHLRFEGRSSGVIRLHLGGEHVAPPWVLEFPAGVTLHTEVQEAVWVQESLLGRPFASVGALVPDSYEAYARILHPAYLGSGVQGTPIRWKAVAERHDKVAHRLMQFDRLTGLLDENDNPAGGRRPETGSLPAEVIGSLLTILTSATRTPGHCYLCLWEGFGGLDVIPDFEELPRVSGPGRDYLLFSGPMDSLAPQDGLTWDEHPQIWWPQDREWCVSTDIDLDSTYIGGSEALIDQLLHSSDLEAYPALISDRLDVGADDING